MGSDRSGKPNRTKTQMNLQLCNCSLLKQIRCYDRIAVIFFVIVCPFSPVLEHGKSKKISMIFRVNAGLVKIRFGEDIRSQVSALEKKA